MPTAARGVDIQKVLSSIPWVAWVTAATGILVYWCTGILVLKHTGGHNIHFCLYMVSLSLFINLVIDLVCL